MRYPEQAILKVLLPFLLLFAFTTPVKGENRFVIVSGGGDPYRNRFSQYLQASRWSSQIRGGLQQPVEIFFGAGNRPDLKQRLPDVYRLSPLTTRNQIQLLPGIIENNRSARKSQLLDYFSELKTWGESFKKNGAAERSERKVAPVEKKLFLLVGDHGVRSRSPRESCIVLWKEATPGDEKPDRDFLLCRSELAKLLSQANVTELFYVMDQCYAGDFHRLAISSENDFPVAKNNHCGYTSTTAVGMAAGCRAKTLPLELEPLFEDSEGINESYVDRLLFFRNLSSEDSDDTGILPGDRAFLNESGINIPLSSSAQFLLKWAALLEKPHFKPRVSHSSQKNYNTYYRRQVAPRLSRTTTSNNQQINRELTRLQQLQSMLAEKLSSSHPHYKTLILAGDMSDLHSAQKARRQQNSETVKRIIELKKEYVNRLSQLNFSEKNLLLSSTPLPLERKLAAEFEKKLFAPLERKFRNNFRRSILLEESVIRQIYKYTLENGRFQELADYYSVRESVILQYALNENEARIKEIGKELEQTGDEIEKQQKLLEQIDRDFSLLSRVINLRRQFGALSTLDYMKEKRALDDYFKLIACEREGLNTFTVAPVRINSEPAS